MLSTGLNKAKKVGRLALDSAGGMYSDAVLDPLGKGAMTNMALMSIVPGSYGIKKVTDKKEVPGKPTGSSQLTTKNAKEKVRQSKFNERRGWNS